WAPSNCCRWTRWPDVKRGSPPGSVATTTIVAAASPARSGASVSQTHHGACLNSERPRDGSVVEGLVDRGPEVLIELAGEGEHLGQHDSRQLLGGVGVPGGAVAAIPAETAGAGCHVVALDEHR